MKALQKNVNFRVLTDEETCSVTGGCIDRKREIGARVVVGSGAIAAASALGSLGCQIASTVYSAKANKASALGDDLEASRLRKLSHNTGIAATSLGGAALVSAMVGIAVGLPTGGLEKWANRAYNSLDKEGGFLHND